jgi:hypothetical protein
MDFTEAIAIFIASELAPSMVDAEKWEGELGKRITLDIIKG